MANPYEIAKKHGYSEEEISAYLSKKDPRYGQALEAGYTPEEIQSYFQKKSMPQESIISNAGRQIGRTGARVAETVLGAPRAFGEFVEGLVPETAIKNLAEKVGLRKPVEKGYEFAKKYAPYKLFPKSEQVRDLNKFLFGKKTEPQNEWEKKADDLVTDFTALALPLPGSKLRLLKPGILALGGNIASEVVGKIGGTEKEQTYAKLGTFLAGSLINPKSAQNLEKNLYKQARQSRPIDAKVNAQSLRKATDNLEKELRKGDPTAGSKKKSLDLLKDIKSKIKNNGIEVEELEQFKRDINESRSGLYEEFKTDKVGRKSAKRNLDTVSKLIDNSLKEYGKVNPEWETFYRPANEVHGAIAQSKKFRNWIARNAKQIGFPSLLAELGLYQVGGLPTALTATGAGVVGLGASEIAVRFMKSPTLQKHYFNLVNSALKEDVVAVRENLKKLNEARDKEESSPTR